MYVCMYVCMYVYIHPQFITYNNKIKTNLQRAFYFVYTET